MVGLLDSVGDILSWLLLVVFDLVYLGSGSVAGQNFMVARLTQPPQVMAARQGNWQKGILVIENESKKKRVQNFR